MSFSIYPIVFINHKGTSLYGELVQTVESRNLCWLRPLLLHASDGDSEASSVVNLRNGPDVICSNQIIQPVLDTDWLDLSSKLCEGDEACSFSQANQHLRQFLQTL